MNTLLAILFGVVFGFILQRVGAFEYKNILNTLRLKDLMIAKFMFLSIGISTVGVFSLRSMGLISLDMINFNLVGTLAGGLVFGLGFAITGYCPGTCIGAWAEGKKDAAYVILGGMAGVLFYTLLQSQVFAYLTKFDMGEITLGDIIELNVVVLAALYSLCIGIIVYLADVIELKIRQKSHKPDSVTFISE
ncbi:MAG: hypothetical protein JG781_2478 [Peptococcaceae bacterium]|jgi:hypothetical protein|nr:hypothetical protein [Peptococcaceae bacterium]